jgi:hypothetical protein
MPATRQLTNIYDLTARESAWVNSPHAELLIEAFKGIVDKKLTAILDGSSTTAIGAAYKAISALERNPLFFVGWFRSVLVDKALYRRWRNDNSKQRILTQAQRPRRPSRNAVLHGMAEYLDHERTQGRVGSQKRAWEWAKNSMPGATHKQITDALRTAEGGGKLRGRPRARSKTTKAP